MRFGSIGEALRWYSSQPPKCGPLTCQFLRAPSEVRMNAPFFVPTRIRALLMSFSYSYMVVTLSLPGQPPPNLECRCLFCSPGIVPASILRRTSNYKQDTRTKNIFFNRRLRHQIPTKAGDNHE